MKFKTFYNLDVGKHQHVVIYIEINLEIGVFVC